MSQLLIVDDDKNIRSSLQKLLAKQGHAVDTAASGEAALARLQTLQPDTLLMDIRMAGLSGLETFRQVKQLLPRLPVIMMTAYGTTDTAIEAMQLGAYEYLLKPFDVPTLLKVVEQALATRRLTQGQVLLEEDAAGDDAAERIVGQSPAMFEVYKRIGQVGSTDVTVLVRGESGTGKELVARAIYQHSQRAQQPFIAVNCAAIPETLLESELFGHEKGAFTGALTKKIGRFEVANGGTIFLDEIGDLPLDLQAKLLRVLQEGEFERVGSSETIKVDVRIIAATNRDLELAIKQGKFREDLFYRLNVFPIQLPPLRERKEDIALLVRYFVRKHGAKLGKKLESITENTMQALSSYSWPGNIRELENVIERSVITSQGSQFDLGNWLQRHESAPSQKCAPTLAELEREHILKTLKSTNWKVSGNQGAARVLGLKPTTLEARMKKLGIKREN